MLRIMRISWPFALLTVAACVLFVSLGSWQWNRGVHRQAVWREFEAGGEALVAATGQSLDSLPRYARVGVEGRYDGARQVLLDNQSREGRPGYELLTPLRLADGSLLLVNRGWLPFSGYRDRLPDVALPPAGGDVITVTGRLDRLPTPGLASGRAPPPGDGPWPRVTTFPTVAELAAIYGEPLREAVLLLDADAGPGFQRNWKPPGVSPDRNFSYAVQWWAFAVLAVVLFVVLTVKRRR
jgi:surfeit locus 1 family protein